tara:strand:+ start:264 stop:377 length:114 start_codon:yes stop_codon:yes gene_type:complete
MEYHQQFKDMMVVPQDLTVAAVVVLVEQVLKMVVMVL